MGYICVVSVRVRCDQLPVGIWCAVSLYRSGFPFVCLCVCVCVLRGALCIWVAVSGGGGAAFVATLSGYCRSALVGWWQHEFWCDTML